MGSDSKMMVSARRVGRASVASLVAVLATASAAAASGWSIQPTPNPAGASSSQLDAVSCSSANACTAVGAAAISGGSLLLAERWNNHKWSIQRIKPAGLIGGRLNGVACSSANACTAVGDYAVSGGTLPSAERWNGHKWSIQPTPKPAGASYTFLEAVSCTSAKACTAVGFYDIGAAGNQQFVERWNGQRWSIQPTPNPTGTSYSNLNGVSCTSPRACTAVGSHAFSTGTGTVFALVERWNGHKWSIQPTPATGRLNGVSCTSPEACTAVGYYADRPATAPALVERWNGHKWSIQPTPKVNNVPAPFESPNLNGVSCTSPKACTAVGSHYGGSAGSLTLVERWNGHQWSIQPTPKPGGPGQSFLAGVSCASSTACTAVGGSADSALAEQSHG